MAAISRHYLDVYTWINQVLDSCVTKEQVTNARHLFLRFEKIYNPNNDLGKVNDLVCTLYRKSVILRDELFDKEFQLKLEENEKRRSNNTDENIH